LTGIVAMLVLVAGVSMRSGMLVAGRPADARGCGREPLQRDGKRQRKGD